MVQKSIFDREESGELLKIRIMELLAKGWTINSLSRALGVDRDTLSRWKSQGLGKPRAPLVLAALGHPMFDRGPSRTRQAYVPPMQDHLNQLLERGWSQAAIADAVGVHRLVVGMWRQDRAGRRDKMVSLALGNPYFNRRPPALRRYPKPDPRIPWWQATAAAQAANRESVSPT